MSRRSTRKPKQGSGVEGMDSAGSPRAARTRRRLLVSGLSVTAGAAVMSGLALTGGGSKMLVALAPAILIAVAVVLVAAVRFGAYIMLMVAVRASLDVAKLNIGAIDTTGVFAALFLLLGSIWLIAERSEPRSVDRSPLVAPLVALFVAGFLSLVPSHHWVSGAAGLMKLATVVVLLAVLNRYLDSLVRLRVFLGALFVSAVLPLAFGALQLAKSDSLLLRGSFERVRGTFTHSNPFSIYLTILIVTAVALYPHLRVRWRIPLAVLLAGSALMLVFTYTRSAWLASVLGVLVVAVLQSKRLIIVLLTFVLAVVILVPSTVARFQDLSQLQTASGAAGNSLEWRIRYWQLTLSLADNAVSGTGVGMLAPLTEEGKLPHNDLIRVYAEMGMLGLAAYLWLFLRLATVARRALQSTSFGLLRGVAVGFAGSLIAVVFLSLASNILSQLVLMWYLAALAAAAVAAERLCERRPFRMVHTYDDFEGIASTD